MNTLKQIGIAIGLGITFLIAILAIIVVWAAIVIYSGIQWLIGHDGFSHENAKANSIPAPPVIKRQPDKLDEEIDKAFSKKPFPKPYSPDDNPLYKKSTEQIQREWAERNPSFVAWLETQGIEFGNIKKPTVPFDREKVFKAVDESNARMSKKRSKHNLRDKDTGRFIKSPITRYGVPTHERFGNQ